jgi:hypothetical protein
VAAPRVAATATKERAASQTQPRGRFAVGERPRAGTASNRSRWAGLVDSVRLARSRVGSRIGRSSGVGVGSSERGTPGGAKRDWSGKNQSLDAVGTVCMGVSIVSDEALLAGLATGDRCAAAGFVRRFQSRVYGLAVWRKSAVRREVHRLLEALGRQLPAPRRAGSGGRFGVVRRRDGTTQLTAGARPLYTFVEDSPGQVNGNGFQDQFGGRHFTWHAVLSSGAIALPAAQPTAKAPVQSTSRSYGSPY